jgi:hypothetical protein
LLLEAAAESDEALTRPPRESRAATRRATQTVKVEEDSEPDDVSRNVFPIPPGSEEAQSLGDIAVGGDGHESQGSEGDQDSPSESASDSSSEASIPDVDEEELLLDTVSPLVAQQIESCFPYFEQGKLQTIPVQHTKSGVLHARLDSMLLCGRAFSKVYARVFKPLRYAWPRCAMCVKKTTTHLTPSSKKRARRVDADIGDNED